MKSGSWKNVQPLVMNLDLLTTDQVTKEEVGRGGG